MNPVAGAIAAALGAGAAVMGSAWFLQEPPPPKDEGDGLAILTLTDRPITHNTHLNKQFVALNNLIVEACRLHSPFQPAECAELLDALQASRAQLNRLATWGRAVTKEGTDRLCLADIDLFQQDLNTAVFGLENGLRARVEAMQNPSLDLRFRRVYAPLTVWINKLGNIIQKNIQVYARRNLMKEGATH